MNTINLPLVSVCIPCYNAEQFIGETLQSVLAQTYGNVEIVVCDDCSTDATVEQVKKFNDPRIKLVVNPANLKRQGNYNNALSRASGKYVKLLCADDIITPDCIEKQVNAFETNADKNIVLVTANKIIIDANGRRTFIRKFPGKGFIDGRKAIKKSIRHGGNICGEPGLPLLRTDAMKKVLPIFDDYDLWIKVLSHGNLFAIDETLFHFRISKGTVTTSPGFRKNYGVKILFQYFDKFYKDPAFGLSWWDITIGKTVAFLKSYARSLITWWSL